MYIISSKPFLLKIIKRKLNNRTAYYIEKLNQGRDISALLIECRKYINEYNYACFLHDKKPHTEELAEDTELWIQNIWGNLLGSEKYIQSIINLFENNEEIGIVVPPPPIGDHFAVWYGFGWQGAFDITKELCSLLLLRVSINENKPPLAIGTALWFRTDALKKLFDYNWKYEDFDDNQLGNSNYLSYGIERIFPYVSQDAGFTTAEVMNTEYASVQNAYLRYSMTAMFKNIYEYYPFLTLNQMKLCEKNVSNMLSQVNTDDTIYLFGAGRFGRFCLNVLRRNLIEPKGFLVSEIGLVNRTDNLPIYCINEISEEEYNNITVIITVENKKSQSTIINLLSGKAFRNIVIFWET